MKMRADSSRKKWKYIFVVLALICLGVGVTIALLMAETEKRANIFKVGEVDLELSEEEWDGLDPEEKKVSPGTKVKKDPKVKNTADSDFYAYLEVWIPTAEVRVIQADGEPGAREQTELYTYVINEPDGSDPGWVELPDYRRTETGYQVYLYGYTEALKPARTTRTLFDEVIFANIVEGDVPEGTDMTIRIYAYGIQSEYLAETGSTMAERLKNAYEKYLAELDD